MSGTWSLALSAVRAHRLTLAGTALTLAAAGGVLAVIGVLMETGLRGGPGVDGGTLTLLASSFAGTAVVVIVLVVATTVALGLRERRREFALLRTIGATRPQVRRQVSLEVLIVAVLAVPVGALVGVLASAGLTPLLVAAGALRSGAILVASPLPGVAALIVLLPTALLGGWLAARETVRMPPTEAVRRSEVDRPGIGRVRGALAALTGAAGLAAALIPVFVPGTIGGATAATSAFLLIGALALGGPAIIGWILRTAAGAAGSRSGPAAWLALTGLAGSSRRLTAVVVPLALALATGTVQTTVDRVVAAAAEEQLRSAVPANLVITSAVGSAGLARVRALPGVTDAVALGSAAAEVRAGADDGPESLAWERSELRTIAPGAARTVFDPGVTSGGIAALSAPRTVAVSSDAAFEQGLAVGSTVLVRAGGGPQGLHVVAVYDRGLGVGDYLTAPGTARALGARPTGTAVLVTADEPERAAAAVRSNGFVVTTREAYVAAATSGVAALQRLSSVLILLLLIFVGIAAADALVLTTASRRGELALLHRLGTTRAQLLRMTTSEAAVTGLLAWLIGTVSVIPAVLAVNGALLGRVLPLVDLPVYGVLSAVVLATALAGTVIPAASVSRTARPPSSRRRPAPAASEPRVPGR